MELVDRDLKAGRERSFVEIKSEEKKCIEFLYN